MTLSRFTMLFVSSIFFLSVLVQVQAQTKQQEGEFEHTFNSASESAWYLGVRWETRFKGISKTRRYDEVLGPQTLCESAFGPGNRSIGQLPRRALTRWTAILMQRPLNSPTSHGNS